MNLLQDDGRMSTVKPDLERARAAYAERSWLEAYEAFARADEVESLAPEDLELHVTTARMLARDDEAIEILERAHHAYLKQGETARAANCAGWIGMSLFYRGAVGPAGGWLARAHRLLEDVPGETAVHGYALLPTVFRQEAMGDFEAAASAAAEAAEIGKRHGDAELMALAIHAQGHMLVLAGRVQEGFALLDEAMVIVTTSEPSPFVVGLVYCGVILACQAGFEVGRAREWTLELTRWVARSARPGRLHGPLPRPSRRDPAARWIMVRGVRGGTAGGRAPRGDEELRGGTGPLPTGRAVAAAWRVRGGRRCVSGCEPERLGASARPRPCMRHVVEHDHGTGTAWTRPSSPRIRIEPLKWNASGTSPSSRLAK